MRKLKSTLVIILSLVMVLSSTTIALAEETVTEVEMAKSLGILKGDSNGVTDEYLAQKATRFQAAVMVLRLKGLEEEAKVHSGSENFEDATEIAWVPGQAMLAYLKDHPNLGWIGSNNKIDPTGKVSAKAYYKVLLELLGYKQGMDFEWSNILSFAEDKGLKAVASIEELTNKDLTIATIEALKMPNSKGVLFINELVEAKVVDATVAEVLGLYEQPLISVMTSALSIDSTTIKVDFDEVTNIKAKDFKIVGMDSKEYEVKDLEIIPSEKAVVLSVGELEVGNIYTVTYNEKSIDIVPIIKENKTQAVIDSAEAITGKLIEVVFNTRNIRKDSLVVANFALSNGANVVDVKLDEEKMKKDGNHNKTIVLLDVINMKSGIAYTLKSDSITSYNHVEAPFNTSNATFAGKDADTKAPKVASAKSIDGYQVEVVFDEDALLDESTALNTSNYVFTPELEVKDAKIKKNILNGDTIVRLTTSHQISNTIYKVKVSNVSDGTNVMKDSEEVVFAGIDVPDNQAVEYAKSLTATTVEVGFKYEANDSALIAGNYSIDNDIFVVDVKFKEDTTEPSQLDRTKVILTTTSMKAGTAYKLKVGTGVQDQLGQGLKEEKNIIFAGQDPDNKFTEVITAAAVDTFTVKVIFDEKLNRDTVTDIKNYKISDLGYPAKVVLSDDCKTLTLTVPKQQSGIAYKITMNNLKDEAGNEIKSDTKVIFAGKDK